MENFLTYSNHARARSGQRSIPDDLIAMLVTYGQANTVKGGMESYFLSNKGLKEAESQLGKELFQVIEKKKNAYVIVSEEDVIVTVAWSDHGHKRIKEQRGWVSYE